METEPENQALPQSTPERPQGLSVLCIVLYLALHDIWRGAVIHPYSFVLLRFNFLIAFIGYFLIKGDGSTMLHYLLGRITLTKKDGPLIAKLLLAVAVSRVGIDNIVSSVPIKLTSQAFASNVITPAINEEVVFRGMFLAILLAHPKLSTWPAIFLSAMIFTGAHYISGPARVVPLMFLGLLLGFAFFRTRSVLVCIACHALWNSLSFVPTSPAYF